MVSKESPPASADHAPLGFQLLLRLCGHEDSINEIVWSPDGAILASGSDDQTVRLWDIESGQLLHTLSGHQNDVMSVAWSPDGQMLASGSEDETIRLWDTSTGRQVSVLESHTAPVMCVRFSSDGHLLASQSGDGTVLFWRCDTWEVTTILDASAVSVIGGLAFHPHAPIMATRDEDNRVICVWRFDLVALLGSSPAVRSVRHMTGKIVLVGDAGVGKTGLGWRLAHGDFKEHPSTHGQQFWMLDTLGSHRADGAECEAVLWDLAGQPDYRLIHSLFLDDAELALLLFNPSERQEPLHGVDFWLKALSHRQERPCRTILIGARMDRGDSSLTTEEIEAFWRDRGITGGYIGTSALTGHGLDELIERIRKEIAWDEMTATVTTATFKWIKQYVLGLKEAGVQEILLSPEALYQQLQRLDPACEFDRHELMTAVGHLAKHGYVRILRTAAGEQNILLQPELLNNLAASFILEARRNPKGLGALDEAMVLHGEYEFPELTGLVAHEREILLDATTVLFLEHNICFREILGSRTLLVFPELINLKKLHTSDEIRTVDDVSYTVTGSVENVYAALVVLLGYTNTFTRTALWQDSAQYEMREETVCGFRHITEREGEIDFVLYYSPDVPPSNRRMFQGLFETFLAGRDVTVRRYPPLECPKCHYRQERVEVIRRAHLRKGFLFCCECGKKISLPKVGDTIVLNRRDQLSIDIQEDTAKVRTQFEAALVWIKGLVRDRDKKVKVPRCFISYAWGNSVHERWVEKWLAVDLRNAGIEVVLDRWHNAAIGLNIARFISLISDCEWIIVVGTPIYRQKYENRVSETGSVVAAEMDLIHQRLTGSEEQKKTILPILLEGNEQTSFPPLLHSRVYADFRREEVYVQTLLDLTLTLHNISFDLRAVADLRDSICRVFEKKSTRG